MNLIEILDITSTNILLIFANIVLIILAIFLLFKIRKSIAKREDEFEPGPYLNKENETDFSGIADIKPEEFNPERFDLNKDFFTLAITPKTIPMEMRSSPIQEPATLSMDEVVNDVGILKTDELDLEDELEDELPEELAAPSDLEIPVLDKEEETAEEEFMVPPEPEITVPAMTVDETEEDNQKEEKSEEMFAVPSEPEISAPDKEEETTEEEFKVPEINIIQPIKEDVKTAEKLAAPPEHKLFTLDEKKRPEEISAPASTELLTQGKTEIPSTLKEGLSGETSIREQKVTKASKRKSLF